MPAATAPDLSTVAPPRLGLAAAPGGQPERDTPTTSITVTLHIDVRGEGTPPAVTGLLESVRALAGRGVVSVTHTPAPAPDRSWPDDRPDSDRGSTPGGGSAPGGGSPLNGGPLSGSASASDGGDPVGGWFPPGEPGSPERPADGWPPRPRPRLVRGDEPAAVPVLRIYLESRLVLRAGVPIRLTRREYDLLTFLCQHPRRVFSRRQLMRQVWGHEMVGGERTVDVHVRRLRVKLDEAGPVISTVRGVGYRLDDVASVGIVADPR